MLKPSCPTLPAAGHPGFPVLIILARCVQVRVLVILIRTQERKEERRERKRR